MFRKSLAIPCAVAAILGASGSGVALAGVPMPTVDGKIFADLTNISQKNNGVDTPASGTGVDVKRFYLVFNEKFDDIWSAKMVTDATYNSGQQVDVYMKNAFLQAQLSRAFWARLGEANMPWIPFAEGVYGYRYVENTLIDRLHFGNSADWGLHVGGQLVNVGDGMLSYRVSAVNGAGYKNPTRSKSMDVEGRLTYRLDGAILAVGGYEGKLGQDKYGQNVTIGGVSTPQSYRTASRFDALAGWSGYGVHLAAEYFSANDWNNVPDYTATGAVNPSDKADGYALYASYDINRMWSVFGRYDQAKLSKDLAPSLKDNYFNVGLQASPIKNVQVALVYKHEKMDGGPVGGSFATTNGAAFNEADGTYDEVGIWTQVAF
jgi:hypothetical protein